MSQTLYSFTCQVRWQLQIVIVFCNEVCSPIKPRWAPIKGVLRKSFSEALILASTNPQYDDRLFIELQVQYMKIPSSNLGRTCCVQKLFLTFRTIFVHNMFSPCSAKRRASDKDLPVQEISIQKHLSMASTHFITLCSVCPSIWLSY